MFLSSCYGLCLSSFSCCGSKSCCFRVRFRVCVRFRVRFEFMHLEFSLMVANTYSGYFRFVCV
jgi:hypothetical protein